MLPPLWYLDYFVVNGFSDCKIYILFVPEFEDGSDARLAFAETNVFTIDLDYLLDPARGVSPFVAPGVLLIIAFAEKGPASTSHVTPIQQHYRADDDWRRYRESVRGLMQSQRPHLVRSLGDIALADVRGGHLFVANDFSARDPSTEYRRVQQRRGGVTG